MGLNRAFDPGWEQVADNDPAGRRGIWMRRTGDTLEVCSGREGDDAYFLVEPGMVTTSETVEKLYEALAYGRWMVEYERDLVMSTAHCQHAAQGTRGHITLFCELPVLPQSWSDPAKQGVDRD